MEYHLSRAGFEFNMNIMSLTKREKKKKKNFHCFDTKILVLKPFLSKNVFIFESGLFKAFLNRDMIF